MQQDQSFLADCLNDGEPDRFSLLGGGDDESFEGSFDEGDYGPYEGDEGDYYGFEEDAMGGVFSKYFWPYGVQLDNLTEFDPPIIYGTNFRGVNLFGLYSWGLCITVVMELMYIGLSKSMWTDSKVVNYGDAGDLTWTFTQLGVGDTKTIFFAIWGSILFLVFCSSLVRYSMQDPEFRYVIVENSFATLLLVLPFIPAGFAGSWWESQMGTLEFSDPELSYDHPGFIMLIVVPILWPMFSNCMVVFGMLLLTVGGSIKSVYMPDDFDDWGEGDEGDWGEGDEGDYYGDVES